MFTASGMHALSKCGHFLQQWFEWGMFAWVTDDCCYCLLLFDWCFLSSGLLNNMNTLTKIIGLLGLFSCCSLAPLSYLQSMTPKFFSAATYCLQCTGTEEIEVCLRCNNGDVCLSKNAFVPWIWNLTSFQAASFYLLPKQQFPFPAFFLNWYGRTAPQYIQYPCWLYP